MCRQLLGRTASDGVHVLAGFQLLHWLSRQFWDLGLISGPGKVLQAYYLQNSQYYQAPFSLFMQLTNPFYWALLK